MIAQYNDIKSVWQDLDLCYDKKWDYCYDSMKYTKQMGNDKSLCVFSKTKQGSGQD